MMPAGLLVIEVVAAAIVLPVALYLLERRLVHDVLDIAGQALPGVDRLRRRFRRREADAGG